ncbi:hypothetical protein DPMN_014245 [Dreissena polymorpha]|uniref:Uncharacterized protein n=1 Tax=Dreissena polymorpha TaxID=45954 RepID=A0A9D4S4H6_DREPO|nr:hypothetical protein DPMN_014245 [Dreissena polymorpha]
MEVSVKKSRIKKRWIDNVKKWTSLLLMYELFPAAHKRHDWRRIFLSPHQRPDRKKGMMLTMI